MVVDEVMLRAFVDGELEADLRAQVDAAVANSPALQAQVQALRASCLPYQAAYGAQALPPPPAELLAGVADLLAVSAATPAPHPAPPTWQPQRRAWLAAGLAASFGAGVMLPKAIGLLQGLLRAPSEPEPWVEAIARYHALYVRETVDIPIEPPPPLHTLLSGFAEPVRDRLRVPDLAAQGLSFRRAQRLGFGAAPLIQLVYLPARGRPVAVCFLPMPGQSAPTRLRVVADQDAATWREAGLAFVVVGDLAPQALDQVVSAIQAQVLV